MKIVRRGALPVGGDTGLDKIKQRGARQELQLPSAAPGEVTRRDVYDGFRERVLRFIDASRGARRCGSCWTAPTAWPGR